MLFLFMGMLFLPNDMMKVETLLTYQSIPEAHDPIIGIVDVVMDKNDNLYILDVDSRKIFSWNKKGEFLSSFGRQGNGPGEFAFNPTYRYYYNLTILDDQLLIWDMNAKKIDFFTFKGDYIKSVPLLTDGTIKYLEANKSSNVVVLKVNYYEKGTPKNEIHLYNKEMKHVKRILSFKSETLMPRYHNGSLMGFRLQAFKPALWVYANPGFDGFIIGDESTRRIDLYDSEGIKKFSVDLQVPSLDIYPDFMEEFKEDIANRRDILEVTYPDKMPYYSMVLPVKEFGYFVANVSEVNNIFRGYIVSYEGKTIGKFDITCGDLGIIEAVNDHLIVGTFLEDKDQFEIKEIKFVASPP